MKINLIKQNNNSNVEYYFARNIQSQTPQLILVCLLAHFNSILVSKGTDCVHYL